MVSRIYLLIIALTSLLGVVTADYGQIYFPGPTNELQSNVRMKHSSSAQDWQQMQHKDSEPKTANTGLLLSLRAQNVQKENIPKTLYSNLYNRDNGFLHSNFQQLPNNPIPRYQQFPTVGNQRLPSIPNNAYQQIPYTAFQQSPYIPYSGFQQSPINPNAGSQQLPINPSAGFQQSPINPNAGFQRSPINPNAGFQQSPINPNAGFQQLPIIPNAGLQQLSHIPSSGYQQLHYTSNAGYQPFPYTSFQQSPYTPNTLYQQPLNTGFRQSFSTPYTGYQQFLDTRFQQSPHVVDSAYQRSPTGSFDQFNSTAFQKDLNTGSQQNPTLGFQEVIKPDQPQIFKLDSLVIVVNPPQTQPQPCIPPTPNTPQETTTSQPDDLKDRFGNEEPTKCTWAIVACCSPDNNKVRENCFELLGCPGFFLDGNPCDPQMVEVAAAAALDYYREANNGTSAASAENSI